MTEKITALERPTSVARLSAGLVEYRVERHGDAAVVVFHGGHMRAGLALGEDVFTDLRYTVLVPSRPGYGRTPLQTGRSPLGFADVVAELCDLLAIREVAAVVGMSGGGPSAVTMAARHPQLVRRLILESAVGFIPWPKTNARVGAQVGFSAATEGATWTIVRFLMRAAPATSLRFWLGTLSTEPPEDVLAALRPEHRATLVTLFSSMRSGSGFLNDFRSTPDLTSEVHQPTLVIATRKDAGVPFANAESLAASIRGAELIVSEAESHFIWFGRDYPAIADKIRRFLTDVPVERVNSDPRR